MLRTSFIAPLLLVLLSTGSTHAASPANPAVAQPPASSKALPPGMIEVPNQESFERPRHPPHTPMSLRKALNITGGVLVGLGGLQLALGAGFYASGNGPCPDNGDGLSCGLAKAIDQGIGADVMIAGGAQILGGLILFGVATAVHR